MLLNSNIIRSKRPSYVWTVKWWRGDIIICSVGGCQNKLLKNSATDKPESAEHLSGWQVPYETAISLPGLERKSSEHSRLGISNKDVCSWMGASNTRVRMETALDSGRGCLPQPPGGDIGLKNNAVTHSRLNTGLLGPARRRRGPDLNFAGNYLSPGSDNRDVETGDSLNTNPFLSS